MTQVKTARSKRIAELNDRLRKEPANRSLGQVLISSGVDGERRRVQGHGVAALASMQAKDFKIGNDPYGERDFRILSRSRPSSALFKIDYYR